MAGFLTAARADIGVPVLNERVRLTPFVAEPVAAAVESCPGGFDVFLEGVAVLAGVLDVARPAVPPAGRFWGVVVDITVVKCAASARPTGSVFRNHCKFIG